jgi:hypothetical protein
MPIPDNGVLPHHQAMMIGSGPGQVRFPAPQQPTPIGHGHGQVLPQQPAMVGHGHGQYPIPTPPQPTKTGHGHGPNSIPAPALQPTMVGSGPGAIPQRWGQVLVTTNPDVRVAIVSSEQYAALSRIRQNQANPSALPAVQQPVQGSIYQVPPPSMGSIYQVPPPPTPQPPRISSPRKPTSVVGYHNLPNPSVLPATIPGSMGPPLPPPTSQSPRKPNSGVGHQKPAVARPGSVGQRPAPPPSTSHSPRKPNSGVGQTDKSSTSQHGQGTAKIYTWVPSN